MKRKLHFIYESNVLKTFVFFAALFLCTAISFGQQITIFNDDFNRGATPIPVALSAGGTPSVNYTNTPVGIAAIQTSFTAGTDYRLQILNGVTAGTAGKSYTMASMPVTPSYNTKLHQNSGLVTWAFNMRHNRSSGSTMTGFDDLKWGVATILACDNANPTSATAKGYAVVMGGVGTLNTYDLVSFSNGLNATLNLTPIITGVPLATFKNVASIKVTYDPISNKWNMYQKDEGSATGTTAYPNPSALAVASINEVSDTAGHVDAVLPNFGFLFSHGTTLNNSFFVDNYKVIVGSVASTTYYLAANSDCAILNNWGTNTNGSGTHPIDFNADNQIFKIFNTGASIGSDWTVNGSGSKIVLGDGTIANSLVIPSTAFLNGKIDLAANSSLTIDHTTTFPTLNVVSPTSLVIYNGAADQAVQTGSYGNLTINTLGIANSPGTVSVAGNLTISNGSVLAMGNKLLAVGSVSGTGTLITTYSSSSAASALPADISWPFSVSYKTLTATQSIVQGNYTNLDITGGGIRNFLAAVISISGNFNADGVLYSSGSSTIIYNGTTTQTIGTDFPGFSLKTENSSASGVSLTVSNRILDTTNIELAGNFNTGGFDETLGLVTLSGNSILNLGSGSHSLIFSNCSAEFWDPTKTLVIKGWSGLPGTSGSAGKIFFGTDASGLTANQLLTISFDGYLGALLLPTGELVPASLGIQNQNVINLKYYPNPVSDVFNLSNDNEISEVTVYNFIGQKVLFSKPNSKTTSINMGGLLPSAYLVEVLSEGKRATFKVIKK